MRFVYNPETPSARKYRIIMREKGLGGRIQEARANFGGDPPPHPMKQVAALDDADGNAWIEPMAIYALLEAVGPYPRLLPDNESEKANALRLDILADGALALAIDLHLAKQAGPPRDDQAKQWAERSRKSLVSGLDAAEKMGPKPEPVSVGNISWAVTLSWLDKFHPDINWKKGHPKLAALQAAMEERASFVETSA